MEIKLKKWLSNPDGKTRYKVVLPGSNFVERPTKEVYFTNCVQVVKDNTIDSPAKYSLTLFGEDRVNLLKELGIKTTELSWQRTTLNIANGINQATTEYMKKKDIISLLEKVMTFEVEYSKRIGIMEPEFRNLVLV